MSVLKYNNNGTWEGLNIDHASTADSALYDADGNVISSTYLPLTAGLSKPLTGSLWLNNSESSSPIQAKIKVQDNGVYFEGYYNGTLDGGLSTVQGDGRVIVYGNGTSVVIRPNGRGDANGQVYFDTNGQQIGGHPITTKGTSKALSAGTSSQDIQSFTITPGTYILISFMDSNTSSTTTYNHIVAVGSVVNKTTRASMGSGGGCLNGFMFTISENTTCTVQAYVSVACTIRNTVWYTRIS